MCKEGNPTEARIAKQRLRRKVLNFAALVTIWLVGGACPMFAQTPSSAVRQTATISGVRKVFHGAPLCTTRYSRIYDFDIYFSLRAGQETYCADYETEVLNEIQDLTSCEGRDLQISLNAGKNEVTIYTPQRRKLKARLVRADRCAPHPVAVNTLR